MAMMTMARMGAARIDVEDDGNIRLEKAWSHEFLHLAMMSAFVSMGCNAVVRDRRAVGLLPVEANLPEEPAIYRAVRQGLLELPSRHAAALLSAQSAYDAVSKGVVTFKTVRTASDLGMADLAHQPGFDVLVETWRSAARMLLQALDVFDACGLLRSQSASGSAVDKQCPLRIHQLLTVAVAGESLASSGLAYDGEGELPDWVQRRRWDRQQFNMACRVTVKDQAFDATIRNISLGGALIDGVPFLMRATPVQLAMVSGRILRASVMWSRQRSIGVRFDTQLAYNDPLIEPSDN